jgi:hypothetical protein
MRSSRNCLDDILVSSYTPKPAVVEGNPFVFATFTDICLGFMDPCAPKFVPASPTKRHDVFFFKFFKKLFIYFSENRLKRI